MSLDEKLAEMIGVAERCQAKSLQPSDYTRHQDNARPAVFIALCEVARAAQECAAPFKFAEGRIGGGEISIDNEGIAREFSRRQQVAAKALATLAAVLGEKDE